LKSTVTIGICVKNGASTLGSTIESIIKQEYPHELMDIIFVNDGSTDSTLLIIDQYLNKIDIKTKIFSHEWKGLGYSRNVVINNATGKYILWVDSDMILSQNYLNKLVKFMEMNLDIGIAKGKYDLNSGLNLTSTLEIYSRSKKSVDIKSKNALPFGTGGSIYRSKAINEVGGFDNKLKGYGEDWNIEYKIKRNGWKFAYLECYYSDYERLGITWNELWRKSFTHGYDAYKYSHINQGMYKLYKMIPPSSFLAGFYDSLIMYERTNKKIAFLLPIQYIFKSLAWCYGYSSAYLKLKQLRTRTRINYKKN
jgi:glycosyltransferase involved in cell wall biosynthesis